MTSRYLDDDVTVNNLGNAERAPAARSTSPPSMSENTTEWVDAAAVAKHLDDERSWVYEHADKLGARPLGTGPKPRLRFRLSDVDAWTACCSSRRSEQGREAAAHADSTQPADAEFGH
jgi:predicted DNA-binding transcriptional regulator AlpA